MELGIQPIVTAGLIMQLLASSKIIGFDNTTQDRALLSGVTKFLSILMTSALAIIYISSGSLWFKPLDLNADSIFFQLFIAGIVVILLDELMQKGWGFGSGISLFIAAGVTEEDPLGLSKSTSLRQNGKRLAH